VEITWDGKIPEREFEPSSIGPASDGLPDIETHVCEGHPSGLAGRLDEVTYLIERCHDKDTWRWRTPNTSSRVGAGRSILNPSPDPDQEQGGPEARERPGARSVTRTSAGRPRGATSAGLSGTVPPSGPWVVTAYGGRQRPRPGCRPGLPSGGDGPGQRHLRVRRPGL
jgi:hypothetical protein